MSTKTNQTNQYITHQLLKVQHNPQTEIILNCFFVGSLIDIPTWCWTFGFVFWIVDLDLNVWGGINISEEELGAGDHSQVSSVLPDHPQEIFGVDQDQCDKIPTCHHETSAGSMFFCRIVLIQTHRRFTSINGLFKVMLPYLNRI